jgi:glutamine amidotransferase PdxT
MDGFGAACEAEGVTVAVAIAKHPDIEQPLVFYRAPHIVDAGTLMAAVLREIKTDLVISLDTEPQ